MKNIRLILLLFLFICSTLLPAQILNPDFEQVDTFLFDQEFKPDVPVLYPIDWDMAECSGDIITRSLFLETENVQSGNYALRITNPCQSFEGLVSGIVYQAATFDEGYYDISFYHRFDSVENGGGCARFGIKLFYQGKLATNERFFLKANDTIQNWSKVTRRIIEKVDSFEILIEGGPCDTGTKLCGTSNLYIDNINMEPYTPVSTQQLNKTALQLLGNPTCNRLRAILPDDSQTYQIIDIQGSTWLSGIPRQNNLDIDIGALASGLYVLMVERRDGIEQVMFVKQ